MRQTAASSGIYQHLAFSAHAARMTNARKFSELRQALGACRGYFWSVGLFSAAINVLYLASPLYMLQVYDRVVSSGSVPTLLMLTVALLIALSAMAALDWVRARILIRAGLRFDRLLSSRVMAAVVKQANATPGTSRSQALRDFDTFRQFITGNALYALCDAPWAPIYIVVITLLHPLLGVLALGCALILLVLALVNERLISNSLVEAGEAGSRSYAFAETSLRNSHVIEAMGMLGGLVERWRRDRNFMLIAQAKASDHGAALQSLIRFLRLSMQSLMLGAGAYLVIDRLATSGIMFAGMILLARALMPIEQSVGTWRQFVSAGTAYRRVEALLQANPLPPATIKLPRPKGALAVQGASFYLPGLTRPLLNQINCAIEPGETLGIIGPSGYETQIGEGGVNLSGGHRQRIALARALYGSPSLVVLDEPSSNLDMDGDVALADCLEKLKEDGRTVVVISHRHISLNTVDKILCLNGGAVAMFGPRKDVMAKLGVKPVAVPAFAAAN